MKKQGSLCRGNLNYRHRWLLLSQCNSLDRKRTAQSPELAIHETEVPDCEHWKAGERISDNQWVLQIFFSSSVLGKVEKEFLLFTGFLFSIKQDGRICVCGSKYSCKLLKPRLCCSQQLRAECCFFWYESDWLRKCGRKQPRSYIHPSHWPHWTSPVLETARTACTTGFYDTLA